MPGPKPGALPLGYAPAPDGRSAAPPAAKRQSIVSPRARAARRGRLQIADAPAAAGAGPLPRPARRPLVREETEHRRPAAGHGRGHDRQRGGGVRSLRERGGGEQGAGGAGTLPRLVRQRSAAGRAAPPALGVIQYFAALRRAARRPGRPALGRSQVVRHRVLVPASGGSNPPAPATARRADGSATTTPVR